MSLLRNVVALLQKENIAHALIGETTINVVRPSGLVLLKLHAGGPKDAWDVRSLLESLEEPGAL